MMNRDQRIFSAKTYSKQIVFSKNINVQAVPTTMEDAALGILVCTRYTLAT